MEILTIRSKPAQSVKFSLDIVDELVAWTGAVSYEVRKGYIPGVGLLFLGSFIDVKIGDYVIKDGDGKIYTADAEGFESTFDILSSSEGLQFDSVSLLGNPTTSVSELIFEGNRIFVELKGVRTEVEEGLYKNGRFELTQVHERAAEADPHPQLFETPDGNGGYAFDGNNGA